MKKTKKALASLAIAGMVLSMAPVSVFAADEDTRLAGADRYLTSIKIAEKAYASADTAVVAAGNPNNLVDALAAAPLAAQEDAPIYLTDKADMNDDVVKSMKALGVDKVIVVGAAASKAVVDELKAAGFEVEEVKGAGRVETAEAINAKLTAPAGTFVVGYDGVADAMSVASYAAANNYAIVVTNQNGTPNGTVEADYIVGGTTRVKDIAGAKRLAGADRYDTNKQVIAELDFDFGTVYVGNGLTLADALVGSVLAAQTDSPIALTDGKTVKADIASNLTDDSVIVALGGTAAVSNAVIDAVKNPPSTGEFKVDTVSAVAADVFAVNFTKAPADASKITFEVKQGTAPVTVSATWDGAKATLKKSSKFVAGTYTVVVKEGDKELANKEITVTEQKVAKIEITSSKLGVVTNNKTNEQTGYATYKVVDQYGVDITDAALANSIQFISGVGNVEARKGGLLVVTPTNGLNLLTYTSGIVITANDRNSGASASATLQVTSQMGTLSDITLNKLTNVDDKELTAGNSVDVFYIDYTATDISGNPTNNYELLEQGLIFKDGTKELTVSSTYVKAELVKDPKDSTKGLIKVTTTNEPIDFEMPLTITAMTWTGKTSQLNLTLKKQAQVHSITLLAPDEAVASGESATIPFLAYDQNNKAVTKYSELEPYVTLSGAEWKKNNDGTASIKSEKVTNNSTTSVPKIITATISKSNSFSSITINIQKEVKADELVLDASVLKTLMQESKGGVSAAEQAIDFGWDEEGLSVKDQYGRTIDMTTAEKAQPYKVVPHSDNDSIVAVSGEATSGKTQIQLQAKDAGSTTVRFDLIDTRLETGKNVVDSKSVTITVLQDKEIKDYVMDEVSKPLYAAGTATAQDKAYNANPKVWGTTAGGAKVVLRGTPILSATVNNGRFEVTAGATGGVAYDGVKVVANKLPDTLTEASATLSISLLGADDAVHSVSTEIKSSKATPVAESVNVVYDTSFEGISYSDETITLKGATGIANSGLAVGVSLQAYNGGVKTSSEIFFEAKDQYGKKAKSFDTIYVDANDIGFAVDNSGKITAMPTKDGKVKVTAVSGSMVKTVAINFVDVVAGPVDTTAPVVTGVEDGKTYTAAVTPASADTDIDTVVLTKDGTAVDGYALGTAISENGAYVLTVTDKAGNATEVSFTIDSESKVLTGDFQDVLGVKFVDVTLPDGVTAVDGVDKDGVAVAEGTGYTVEGSKLTIVDVTDANVITVTIGDDVYTVVK